MATRIVYGLVALAGLFELVRLFTGPNPRPTTTREQVVGATRSER